MKLEISEDDQTYRLVDGIEGTSSYVTGYLADFGETAVLEKDGESLPWEALIDENGDCSGYATQGSASEPIGFELGCDLSDCDQEDDGEGDGEEEEETTGVQ